MDEMRWAIIRPSLDPNSGNGAQEIWLEFPITYDWYVIHDCARMCGGWPGPVYSVIMKWSSIASSAM